MTKRVARKKPETVTDTEPEILDPGCTHVWRLETPGPETITRIDGYAYVPGACKKCGVEGLHFASDPEYAAARAKEWRMTISPAQRRYPRKQTGGTP